jgi:hypothetical protein
MTAKSVASITHSMPVPELFFLCDFKRFTTDIMLNMYISPDIISEISATVESVDARSFSGIIILRSLVLDTGIILSHLQAAVKPSRSIGRFKISIIHKKAEMHRAAFCQELQKIKK